MSKTFQSAALQGLLALLRGAAAAHTVHRVFESRVTGSAVLSRALAKRWVVGLGLLSWAGVTAAAPSYTVAVVHAELDAWGPVDLNDRGHVAFARELLGGYAEGVVCKKNCRVVKPLVRHDDTVHSTLSAIDSHGRAVGYSPVRKTYSHALFFDGRKTIDLGAFPEDDCGGCSLPSWANGVNDKGQVVGVSMAGDGNNRAALWQEGAILKLPTLGGAWSEASDINNRGDIAGTAEVESGFFHAFLYRNGKMHDLGLLGAGNSSRAYGINEAGLVVGEATTKPNEDSRPFVYSGGQMKEIPLPTEATFGAANRINSTGWVVGTFTPLHGQNGIPIGFVYDGLVSFDLNDVIPAEAQATWIVRSASAINTQGQILVSAEQRSNRTRHVLLLTPQ